MTPGLGGCEGLILDPNDDCEDILEVLMKQKCQKCPQTQHLDQNEVDMAFQRWKGQTGADDIRFGRLEGPQFGSK